MHSVTVVCSEYVGPGTQHPKNEKASPDSAGVSFLTS